MASPDNKLLLLNQPSERVKRRTDAELPSPDSKRIALPTQLNQLDDLTLGHVIALLSTKDLLPLIQMGNWLLNTKITAQLRLLDFNRDTLPVLERRRWDSFAFWKWPDLLTRPLPHITHLSINHNVRKSLAVHFDLLPPTLTRLVLSDCIIRVGSVAHAVFKLPLLHDLSLLSVSVNQHEYDMQLPITDDQWLLPSIRESPLLARVAYRTTPNASFHSIKAISSLVGLESLSISRVLIDESHWPRHLNSLQIFNDGEVVSIPSTITRLQLPHMYSGLQKIMSLVPDTLVHLELPITTSWSSSALIGQLIGRFTNLQTFNLKFTGRLDDDFFDEIDMSRLPASITMLSSLFALKSSQWRHLPPHVKFVATDEHQRFRDLPRYDAHDDANQLPYFPKNLHQMSFKDCFVPMEMPYLTRVHFDLIAMHIPDHTGLLDNLPPVLTTLTINTDSFLLESNDFNMAKRFPHLTTMWLNAEILCNQDTLAPWMNTLPASLTHLALIVQHVPYDDVVHVDLENVTLPPRLRLLNLDIDNASIDLPKALPQTIYSVDIQVTNIGLHRSIANWPLGLRHLDLEITSSVAAARHEHQTRTSEFKRELNRRIAEKFGYQAYIRPALPFKFE